MGAPLRVGSKTGNEPSILRFTQDDNEKSQLVVIVNRKLAEHYWHGEDPIGKRLHVGTAADPNPWLTIIGEIPNLTQGGLEDAQDHLEQYFQPLAQVNVKPGTKGKPQISQGTRCPS